MSEPTTAAGRKMLGVLDSLMAVLHGIATADLPENIAAHAKTTDQVKEELAALVLAIEAEAAAPAPLDVLVAARAVVDAWEETVTATVISRTNWAIERLRYALAAALDEEPGDPE